MDTLDAHTMNTLDAHTMNTLDSRHTDSFPPVTPSAAVLAVTAQHAGS